MQAVRRKRAILPGREWGTTCGKLSFPPAIQICFSSTEVRDRPAIAPALSTFMATIPDLVEIRFFENYWRDFGTPPNGLELSCPAEAGRLTRIVRPARGQGKQPRKRRPPGQLQRVVGRPRNGPLGVCTGCSCGFSGLPSVESRSNWDMAIPRKSTTQRPTRYELLISRSNMSSTMRGTHVRTVAADAITRETPHNAPARERVLNGLLNRHPIAMTVNNIGQAKR